MNNYIPADKLLAEIQRRKQQDIMIRERGVLVDNETAKASLQREKSSELDGNDKKIREELWEYFHRLQLESDREFSPTLSIDEILSWLESPRQQSSWKPTKDEITAIEVAVDYLCAHTSDKPLRENTTSVLRHLKQLPQQEGEIMELSFKGGTYRVNGEEHTFKGGKAKVVVLEINQEEE